MTDPVAPPASASTLPPPSVNGSAPPRQPASRRRGRGTRISGIRIALIAGIAVLILVLIFIQHGHAVSVSFLGGYPHRSLAVALLLAAVAGALVRGAAGTARVAELRQIMRRDRCESNAG